MIFEHVDPILYLKEVLKEKVSQNPRYSMRSFAQKLGLSPGGLSLILSRKKKLSVERAYSVAQTLELNDQESEYFALLIQFEGTN